MKPLCVSFVEKDPQMAEKVISHLQIAGIEAHHCQHPEALAAQHSQQAFDVVVAGDDVTHGKPHPEPYEKAAALLGCKPSECIAIEDSTTGLRSAEAAGCLPLGIVNLMPLEQTGNRVIKESLTGMNLDALRGLM